MRASENIYCTTFSDIWHIQYASKKRIDGYRFGFNGQEKVNEVAGIGNWNTAEFGEYNTRTGIRANRDPKPNPSMSPYAVFSGNPIMFSDALLDSPYVSQIKPDAAERFIGWLFTPILKPVKALEDYGSKNWYVERDSHYGPLGFKYNGWPMWKAIWGVGGAAVGGGALYYSPSLMSFTGFSIGSYNAANDVIGAVGNKSLPYNQQMGKVDFANNSAELIGDVSNMIKMGKGYPNPLNILGISTFIMDNTIFKDKDASKKTTEKKHSTPQKSKPKKHSSGIRSPYAL